MAIVNKALVDKRLAEIRRIKTGGALKTPSAPATPVVTPSLVQTPAVATDTTAVPEAKTGVGSKVVDFLVNFGTLAGAADQAEAKNTQLAANALAGNTEAAKANIQAQRTAAKATEQAAKAVITPARKAGSGIVELLASMGNIQNSADNGGLAIAETIGKATGNKALEDNAKSALQYNAVAAEKGRQDVGYVGARAAAGAARGVENLINEMTALSTRAGESALREEAAYAAGMDALLGTNNAKEQTDLADKVAAADLWTPAEFGTKYAANVESRYDVSEGIKAVGDVSETVGQMLPAVLSYYIAEGSPLFVTGLSAAGGATTEALKNGANKDGALLYGVAVGTLEAVTEKLFDGMAGVFGKGSADEWLEKTVKNAVSTEAGQKAILSLADGLGEGLEEFISEVGDRVLNELFVDTDDRNFWETMDDATRSAFMGMVVSGVMQAANTVLPKKPKDAAEVVADSILDELEQGGAMDAGVSTAGDSYGVIDYILNRGRVSNTTANAIISNPEMSAAFTDVTGYTLEGTTENKRSTIRRAVREYGRQTAQNEATAREAAVQAEAEDAEARRIQAQKDSGYRSYVRGIFLKGATVADAQEILNNPELKAEWESVTGKRLPENAKSATKMILETKRNAANIDLTTPKARVSTPVTDTTVTNGAAPPAVDKATAATPDAAGVKATKSELPDTSVGAMSLAFPYVEKQNQQNSTQSMLTEEEKKIPGLRAEDFTHRVVTDAEAKAKARSRVEMDMSGEMTDLSNRYDWDKEDVTVAEETLSALLDEARKSGDYSKAISWRKVVEQRKSQIAQALQGFAQYAKTPAEVVVEAAEKLEDAGVKGEEFKAAMDNISQLAEQYDAAAKSNDVNALADIVRKTAFIRQTASFSNKKLGSEIEWALARVIENGDVEFLKEAAASSVTAISNDYIKPTFKQVLKSWRIQSMLSKATTTLRNLISNGVFDPIDRLSNNISVPLDVLIANTTGTRSVATEKGWASEAKRKGALNGMAKALISVGLDIATDSNSSRYEMGSNRTSKMSGGIVSKLLSTWEKYSGYALNVTDATFKGGIEAEVKRGLQALLEEGKISQEVADKAQVLVMSAATLPEPMKAGTVVNATDRNNYGKVVSYNAANDTYAVRFVSPSGATATVNLASSQLLPTTYEDVPTRQQRSEENRVRSASDIINEMAAETARYRTFQDDTMLSKATLKARDALNIAFGLGDALLPFAKTPANLTARAVEYSPVGLAKGLGEVASVLIDAKRGKVDLAKQSKAVRDVGRGITGSTMIGVSALLALEGVLKVLNPGDDEDADKLAVDKQSNLKGAQLNVSALGRWIAGKNTEWRNDDVLFDIAFLEPMNAFFTTGALIAEDIEAEGLGNAHVLKNTLEGTIKAVKETPVLQGINNLLTDIEYADGEDDVEKLINAGIAYSGDLAASMIPNALKGLVQGTDTTQRDLYTSDTALGTAVDAFKAALPWARNTLPAKTDSFGNVMYNEDKVLNFLNNNILPGTVQRYKADNDVVAFLEDISIATGETHFYPDKSVPKDIKLKGETYLLEQADKDDYKKVRGDAYQYAVELIMDASNRLSDAEAADLVSKAKSYSNAVAKLAYFAERGIEYELPNDAKSMQNAIVAAENGIDLDIWFDVYDYHDNATPEYDRKGKEINDSKKEKVVDYINGLKIPDEEKDYLYLAYYNKESSEKDKKKALRKLPWN